MSNTVASLQRALVEPPRETSLFQSPHTTSSSILKRGKRLVFSRSERKRFEKFVILTLEILKFAVHANSVFQLIGLLFYHYFLGLSFKCFVMPVQFTRLKISCYGSCSLILRWLFIKNTSNYVYRKYSCKIGITDKSNSKSFKSVLGLTNNDWECWNYRYLKWTPREKTCSITSGISVPLWFLSSVLLFADLQIYGWFTWHCLHIMTFQSRNYLKKKFIDRIKTWEILTCGILTLSMLLSKVFMRNIPLNKDISLLEKIYGR